jgi:DNA polymerase-4
MDACENVTSTIIESRGHEVRESLLYGPGTSPQRPKLESVAGMCGTTKVVPSQPVVAGRRWWIPTSWDKLGKRRAAKKMPHIVHVKVDELFATVERVLNARLRGRPVIVGRSVVASASCEAKIHGVKTGMSLIDAMRVCPKASVVRGHYEHYVAFAERVRRILETYTPAVETAALGDFYLDFAGGARFYTGFEGTLRRLQAEVLGRTGLNVSVGAGRTKVVASIASQLDPHGVCIVPPGAEEAFLAPLPVEKLSGVGQAYAVALVEHGITTMGQLRRIPKPVLVAAFGEKIGKEIWKRARGLDGRKSPRASASVSREMHLARLGGRFFASAASIFVHGSVAILGRSRLICGKPQA